MAPEIFSGVEYKIHRKKPLLKKNKKIVLAYIGLGSNLGDRAANINLALNEIANSDNIFLAKFSKMIETKPLAGMKQPDYFNCVAQLKTSLTPEKLLDKLQFIEDKLGRTRNNQPNSSRTIDLDILLYDEIIVDHPKLKIPHPQMHMRSFVIDCLCEIDENITHPILNRTVAELSSRVNGQNYYIDPKSDKPKLVSIAGVVGVGKTTLARSLAVLNDANLLEEDYKNNPYLEKVYNGQQELALKSELYFLNDSTAQLGKEKLQDGKLYVSDYIFDKAFVYANRWLKEEDLQQYKIKYAIAQSKIVKPSAVIYLKDKLDRCLDRIKKRHRPFEQEIEINFLADLEADYDKLFHSWETCPVITVKCSDYNLMDIKSVRSLSDEIMYYVHANQK